MSSQVTEKMSFTPAQCRAARALLNWSQGQLAEESKVATKTIADFEREGRTPYPRTLADLEVTLRAAGIEFTNGGKPGVAWLNWKWFVELYKPDARAKHYFRYFPDGASLVQWVENLKARKTEDINIRIHVPADASRPEHEAVIKLNVVYAWPPSNRPA
jgi:transcriptional regulator with XRE-family HTH domain